MSKSIGRHKWDGGYFYILKVRNRNIYKVGMTVRSPEHRVIGINAMVQRRFKVRRRHWKDKATKIIASLFIRDVERCRWLETMMKREIYDLRIDKDYSRKAHVEWFIATRRDMVELEGKLRFYVNRVYTPKTGRSIEEIISRRDGERKSRMKQAYIRGG